VARSLGRPFCEAPGADHGLEIPGDPVRSADVLRRVTLAMDTFVRGLAAG
jgi:hypothetical protein